MQGMNFGMDGPSVTGWWYNPQTGDKFNAVDTYFEDNNLLIKTADGRLLNYNQIQNFVQVDDPKSIPDKKPAAKAAPASEEIPASVLAELEDPDESTGAGLLIPDDDIYGKPRKQAPSAELGNIYTKTEPSPTPAVQDFAIIDRALAGKTTPTPIADLEWDGFPKREIEMLIDVMNIPEDEIIQYYINSISVDSVKQMLNDGIRRYISTHLHEKKTTELSSGTSTKTTDGTTTTPKKTTKKK
jgi:hypothetical protein